MLDLESTSIVISLETATAFQIPVVKRSIPARALDVRGQDLITEGLFTIPHGLSF
jgi:hypothetical protein